MAEFVTILEDLSAMIRLGIHPHEAEPQPVTISVRLAVDYLTAPAGDAIGEVLDYDFLRDGILRLARERRFALQETLCEAIVALSLRDERVRSVTVRTMKTGIYPDARIGCEVTRDRRG